MGLVDRDLRTRRKIRNESNLCTSLFPETSGTRLSSNHIETMTLAVGEQTRQRLKWKKHPQTKTRLSRLARQPRNPSSIKSTWGMEMSSTHQEPLPENKVLIQPSNASRFSLQSMSRSQMRSSWFIREDKTDTKLESAKPDLTQATTLGHPPTWAEVDRNGTTRRNLEMRTSREFSKGTSSELLIDQCREP